MRCVPASARWQATPPTGWSRPIAGSIRGSTRRSASSPTTTDSTFRIRTLALAERKAAQSAAPVWLYSFDWETPVFGGRLKAYHALDVPFVFDTIDVVGATDRGPVAHDLARRMQATWAAFARTGTPDNAEIPHWPA